MKVGAMAVASPLCLVLVALLMQCYLSRTEELTSCEYPPVKCFVEPCSVAPADLCKPGEKCNACGCTAACAPEGAQLQYPLHKCSDGSLALTCDALSGVRSGSKCDVVDCKPGYLCKEYLCGSGCQAQCVPVANNGTGASAPEYICPDGTPTTKCPVPPGTDPCGITCDKRADTVCGHFVCGSPPTCGPVCARRPNLSPSPIQYTCPDGSAAYKCDPPAGTTDCPIYCDTLDDTVCGHFTCGKSAECGPVCAKRKALLAPSPLPPEAMYSCPDGRPAQKCQLPASSNMTCKDIQCTTAGMMCGNFICGDLPVCGPVCIKDPFHQEPEPSPYMCPDNKTQALMCSSGTDDWDKCADCQNKEGFVCSQFQCGGKDTACSVMCLPDPYYKPYLCPNDQPGKKCDPPTDQIPECNPKCTDLGTFCAPLECNGVCSYTCVQDPWFQYPESTCPAATPLSGKPGTMCKEAAVTSGQTCSTLGELCSEGMMCRHLNCGAGCSAYCVEDPYYFPPLSSEYWCPDNSTALTCSSYKDVVGNWECASISCEEGTVCGNFKCGNQKCKAMCLKDPWYRPYICPGSQDVAKWCDVPPDKPITCPECAAKGPGYFCASFNCGGGCAPVCMKDPWYEPAPYICDNGAVAQQCPGNRSSVCAATTCAEGYVCGNFDCSGTPPPLPGASPKCTSPRPDGTRDCLTPGGTTSGTLLASTAGRLVWAGSTSSAAGSGKPTRRGITGNPRTGISLVQRDVTNCIEQCVKDPWYSPALQYTCADGSVANKCGPLSSEPVCSPACTKPGTFCMNTACGMSSSCSPQCVADPYYQPPLLICPESNMLATVCNAQPSPSKCTALKCEEQSKVCAVVQCGQEDACETRCVWEKYMMPWTPPAYTCGDASSTLAAFCSSLPNSGEATCSDVTCPDGMYCADMQCPDADGNLVCAPKCVPVPPKVLLPPGGATDKLCPGGIKPRKPCTGDPCAKSGCAAGSTCVVNQCDCTTQCVKNDYSGPVVVGPVVDPIGSGVKQCAKGKAVDRNTCTGKNDPCKNMECDANTQKCVAEYCGGCRAACLPKKKCKNGKERRACIGGANFCQTTKCKKAGAQCIADQCNNCLAKCVGPCSPGQHLSKLHARCIKCPQGHACAGNTPGPATAALQACNNGYFADEGTQPVVKCKKCPDGTTTPNTPGVGYTKCTPIA